RAFFISVGFYFVSMTCSGGDYKMFVFYPLLEIVSMVTYSDIKHAYGEMQRHNALIQDALRQEVKLLKECYVRSLGCEDISSASTQPGAGELVRIERVTEGGKYEKCAAACLPMSKDGVIEFRICTLINETPTGNMFIPAYITMEYCDNLIKVCMSLSNGRSDKRAELYVSRGEEVQRYEETAEYIKSMLMCFIADQKLSG
ncbi:hypothetical protein, partial [Escherichia coli]|uniref:hypothetical protein n=1 Tax=Escherichia coli TaxID=562 RepID=UPI0020BEE632